MSVKITSWHVTTALAAVLALAIIAARVGAKFGISLNASSVGWKAKRDGWPRSAMRARSSDRFALEERLFTASFERWAHGQRPDNAVRRVKPGTHAANGHGYRMGSVIIEMQDSLDSAARTAEYAEFDRHNRVEWVKMWEVASAWHLANAIGWASRS